MKLIVDFKGPVMCEIDTLDEIERFVPIYAGYDYFQPEDRDISIKVVMENKIRKEAEDEKES